MSELRALKPAQAGKSEAVRFTLAARTTIDPRLFEKFQALIYKAAGIWLSDSKTALLCGRLARRLRSLDFETMDEYFECVTHPDQQEELVRMIDAITTNETHFFREPKHFDFMSERLFPRWKAEAATGARPRNLRIWSAGCSSGEEPYSLAMLLLKHFPALQGWTLQIEATDISTQVLAKATAGIYPVERARDIPDDLLHAYALQGSGEQHGKVKIGPDAQAIVRFTRVNLNDDKVAMQGTFDAIFCRNVLIYFDMDSKKKVVDTLTRHLSPKGLLFVGHSENLAGVTTRMKSLAPTIYGFTGADGKLLSDFRRETRPISAHETR